MNWERTKVDAQFNDDGFAYAVAFAEATRALLSGPSEFDELGKSPEACGIVSE